LILTLRLASISAASTAAWAEDLGPLNGLDTELGLSVAEKLEVAMAYTYGAVKS
jgi:hypothetical protein